MPSPIGRQGLVLGRGKLRLSPEVIRRVGPANIAVLASPAKLALTPAPRFDPGDAALDGELAGHAYLPVVIGHRQRRVVKVSPQPAARTAARSLIHVTSGVGPTG